MVFDPSRHPRGPSGRFSVRATVGSFLQFMDAAIAQVEAGIEKTVQEATFKLFTKIVERTPEDLGQARGNWTFSIGGPAIEVFPGAPASRGFEEAAKALTMQPGSVAYFTNSLPYIRVLEFGLYPNPPIRGTYIRRGEVRHGLSGPGWHKFSEHGFSKLAPQGMVRVSIVEFNLRTK